MVSIFCMAKLQRDAFEISPAVLRNIYYIYCQ